MTKAERLDAVLLKIGAATEAEIKSGVWSEGRCPFTITPFEDGSKRITIDKGDALMRVTGKNMEEAITKLEIKAGLITKEEG